ncbi:aminotransferase class I/II-fold pyridoxal phosphate-dependent enzyme [Lutibacter sp. HS1-25]|uniref:pyridoxal phosphate-dependent aminotransferase n=1 Tax=Lutibacter sp. HS1-25 TaxID=2485000 RepID=UPI0010127C17|nr:aminotransferase class I/II-fold pyridoxal phosphate-dependent enzyme [Lutibacter sp. HS1-25]RXP44953.1 aminotransferase class I/II-fold pyridoxal phosphate-dependent enzyme [Lutibacter sp. HS1-25]
MIQKADRLSDVQEYYFSKKLREVAALKSEGKPVINIAIGSPDLHPSASVIKAIQSAVELPNAHQYQSYQGTPELREGIRDFYKNNYQVELNAASEILPLMGSKEGIMHISMAFLNKGDKVLIPNPGYPTYASVTKLVEAVPVFYNLTEANNWLPNFEELEQEDLANVKIMWVNYPHMPTGAQASKADFEQLIAFAKKHNILIVNDNPYSFILHKNQQSILAIEGAKEVAIELNSLSKTYNMAGWRVGMVVGDAQIIQTILEVKSNMDSGMFLGIQKGAVEALKLSNDWFESLNEIYLKRRAVVWQIFDALNCTYDKNIGGLFVWAKIPKGTSSEEITDNLLYKKDVFITPGTIFGSNGEGYIRASLCVTEEVLNEVLGRLTNDNY